MKYRRILQSGIVVVSTSAEHAGQLEELQRVVFPTLADDQRFKAPHYLKHIELFPEGQFVALDGVRVVGMTTSLRLRFDFAHPGHRFRDLIRGGWLTSHDPTGDWLYGADVGTHPDYRSRGVARALYAARHDTVRKLGLRGQVTVAMPTGYGVVKREISAADYYARLLAGEISDPTVSAQRKIGFELRGLLPNYLDDPVCDNHGVLLVLDASKEIDSQ